MDSDFDRKPSIFACSSIQTPFFEKRFLRNSRFFHGNPFFRQTLATCRPAASRNPQAMRLQFCFRKVLLLLHFHDTGPDGAQMVVRDKPVAVATVTLPPRPKANASHAAH